MLSTIEHLKTGPNTFSVFRLLFQFMGFDGLNPLMDSKNANQSNQDRCFRKSRMKTCLILTLPKMFNLTFRGRKGLIYNLGQNTQVWEINTIA